MIGDHDKANYPMWQGGFSVVRRSAEGVNSEDFVMRMGVQGLRAMIIPPDFLTLLLAFINAATFDNGVQFPYAWSCIPLLLAIIVSARRAFDYT